MEGPLDEENQARDGRAHEEYGRQQGEEQAQGPAQARLHQARRRADHAAIGHSEEPGDQLQQGHNGEAGVEDPQETPVLPQFERVREAQEEVDPEGREQGSGQGAHEEDHHLYAQRGGARQDGPGHQQGGGGQIEEVAGGLALRGRDHHQEADSPGDEAVQEQGQLGQVETFHQPHGDEDQAALTPHRVDQDRALGLAIDEGLGLEGSRLGWLVGVALDLHQLVALQEAGFLGHPVGQNFPDDDFAFFHLPGALVVGARVDPLVEGEGTHGEAQAGEADPQQAPPDAFEVGVHGAFCGRMPG